MGRIKKSRERRSRQVWRQGPGVDGFIDQEFKALDRKLKGLTSGDVIPWLVAPCKGFPPGSCGQEARYPVEPWIFVAYREGSAWSELLPIGLYRMALEFVVCRRCLRRLVEFLDSDEAVPPMDGAEFSEG